MLEKTVVCLLVLILSTVLFLKRILFEKGIYKLKAVAMWIALYDLRLIFNVNDQSVKLWEIDFAFIIFGIIWGTVCTFKYTVNTKDFWGKISAILIWIYMSFAFAVSALQLQQLYLVYGFKVWMMLTLLMGLISLRNISISRQIIGAIIIYVIMLGANAIISNEFLVASSGNHLWHGIYETIQRSYCLNPVNDEMSEMNIKTYIIDFFICKIMDVTLLGFLSAKFLEMVRGSNSVTDI